MKTFKKQKYVVVRNAIKKNIANFIYHYLNNKRNVCHYLRSRKLISPFDDSWGTFNDKQIANTYSCYSDLVMETLLLKCRKILEKETKLKLIENYSYARIYKKFDTLFRHKDRPECEISCTMNLGGDPWAIYVKNKKQYKIMLAPGDLIIYRGCDLEHWRDVFTGDNCTQVFLHYSPKNKKDINKTKYDGRPFIGLPEFYKGKK